MVQDVNETIDVLSIFRDGRIQPVKFKWGGRTLKVSRIAYSWVTKDGAHPQYHFSLLAGSKDVYEVVFDTFKMMWLLARVHLQ